MKQMLKPKQIIVFVFFVFAHFNTIGQGKIVMNGAYMNVVNSAYVVTKDVSLTNPSTLNVNNSTLKVAGTISSSSNIDVQNGTLEVFGTTPQVLPANAFTGNKMQNLIVSNNVSLAGEDSLTGILSFGRSNKDFSTGGLLTLKSTAAYTAMVADITGNGTLSGNSISGDVKVERYIQMHRAWRFLTAPVMANTQTISQAWQEGQLGTNSLPGFGTHITGGSVANGFDQGINNNVALKVLSGGAWIAVPNTNATSITNYPGYMVFIRGGRDVNLSQGLYATPSPTVLRSIGNLKTYSQSFTVAPTGFTVIGNPFAAPLNLNSIAKSNSTNIQDNFYLWDPLITGSNGIGGYVNISWNGSSYDITPSSGGSGLNQFVPSGYAFLARTVDGITSGTLVIKETDKSVATNISARTVANPAATLKTNMYAINADGSKALVDGILNSFSDIYSNAIDQYDAVKMNNISETLSSLRGTKSLMVERRKAAAPSDTVFLNMLQMKVKYYEFRIEANNFTNTNLSAFLEDSYTNTSTPVNLQGNTTVGFNVINVPGSWNPQRFKIVFKEARALPVTFTNAWATSQDDGVKINWTVENEVNIQQYEIEKSADGQQFVKANTVAASGNNTATTAYAWTDQHPYNGNTFYRIKSIGVDGEIKYSAIFKINTTSQNNTITLQTNVITGNQVVLQMNNAPKGSYSVNIFNALGQVMLTKKIEHQQGVSTETIELNKNYTPGIYNLSIVKPDQSKVSLKMIAR